jgi:hypothetical protein
VVKEGENMYDSIIDKKAIIRRKSDRFYGEECTIIYDYKTGITPVIVKLDNGVRLAYEYYDLDIL